MDNVRVTRPDDGRNQLSGRIEIGGDGMGPPSDDLVAERAREIAEVENRAGNVSAEDYARARRELSAAGSRADEGPDSPELQVEDAADARDPSQVHGTAAHQTPDLEPKDEELIADRLVREGVAEADHEQMLEARRSAGQENENLSDEDPVREEGLGQ